ncbi:MAG: DEAD/DEAH box helicase family protein [Colwellia sp.]|nr:DEAD/DEAH box helicase family protein [Colwellia sp.]
MIKLYYQKTGFVVRSDNKYVEYIIHIARTLGYRTETVFFENNPIISINPVHDAPKPQSTTTSVDDMYMAHVIFPTDLIPTKCGYHEKSIRKSMHSESKRDNKKPMYSFTVEPLEEDEYYGFEIRGNDRLFLLGDCTVTHNTVTAIYLSTVHIKLQTVILIPGITCLIPQWVEEIEMFTDAVVQKITARTRVDPNANFYIVNCQNVHKLNKADFTGVGLVIVDEAHAICTEKRISAMFTFTPRYLIGLTATPYRPDGFDKLLSLYFGNNYVSRKLNHPHLYYRIDTGFKPESRETDQGRLDWAYIMEQQANHETHNELVGRFVDYFSDNIILIFCKRTEHVLNLFELLSANGVYCDTFYGTKKTFDKECRVLISNIQKSGVGFNWKRLNMLIIAADVAGVGTVEEGNYFIQYLGRSMRVRDNVPIILDFVDDNWTLGQHHKNRVKVSKIAGGIYRKKFKLEWLDNIKVPVNLGIL